MFTTKLWLAVAGRVPATWAVTVTVYVLTASEAPGLPLTTPALVLLTPLGSPEGENVGTRVAAGGHRGRGDCGAPGPALGAGVRGGRCRPGSPRWAADRWWQPWL